MFTCCYGRLNELFGCVTADGVVVKAACRQLKYNIYDGQVQTEQFLEGQRNKCCLSVITNAAACSVLKLKNPTRLQCFSMLNSCRFSLE